jgi:hypothetical protein
MFNILSGVSLSIDIHLLWLSCVLHLVQAVRSWLFQNPDIKGVKAITS